MANVGDEAALRDLPKHLAAAETEANVDKILAYFTDDAILMDPGIPPLNGAQAIRSFWQDPFQNTRLDVSEIAQEVQIAGPWAYIRMSARVTLTSKAEGNSQNLTGKGIWIAKQQRDASWKLIRTAFNFDS